MALVEGGVVRGEDGERGCLLSTLAQRMKHGRHALVHPRERQGVVPMTEARRALRARLHRHRLPTSVRAREREQRLGAHVRTPAGTLTHLHAMRRWRRGERLHAAPLGLAFARRQARLRTAHTRDLLAAQRPPGV